MNRELLNLKKLLIRSSYPSREEKVAKALRVLFKSVGDNTSEGMTKEEAYEILRLYY